MDKPTDPKPKKERKSKTKKEDVKEVKTENPIPKIKVERGSFVIKFD